MQPTIKAKGDHTMHRDGTVSYLSVCRGWQRATLDAVPVADLLMNYLLRRDVLAAKARAFAVAVTDGA